LGEEVFQEIRKMLRKGTKPNEIAKALDCGASTVYRVRREMKAESGEDSAA
jgi:DNA invertase Pin-like site-specific DNA recombinase